MITNKDTVKALNAATTLIKYCNKYKLCTDCVFYKSGCAVNKPFEYREIDKEVNK